MNEMGTEEELLFFFFSLVLVWLFVWIGKQVVIEFHGKMTKIGVKHAV